MSVKVHLLPSGHEFTAEPQETLLEAALRAGMALTYRCNNGACGECKARLVSGALGERRFHDYLFSTAEKASGHFLMCRTGAASDVVIEAKEAGGAQDIPQQQIKTHVHKLERLDPEIMALYLRTPRTQTLRFLAGQHVRIEIPGLAPRHKSIASCPCNAMYLQFHLRRIPDDPFSEHAFSKLLVGQCVVINGPQGNFTLDENANRPVIFLAYETGFAPIKSLIEHALALEFERPMHLYWVTHRNGERYLDNLCRSWNDAFDNFTYTALTGDCESTHHGNLSAPERDVLYGAQHIVRDYPDLSGFDIYTSGPEALVTTSRALLYRQGLPPSRFFVDSLPYL